MAKTKTKKIKSKTATKKKSRKASGVKKTGKEKVNIKASQTKAKTKSAKSKTKPDAKAPQTMEELIKQTGYTFTGLKRGDKVEGIVTDMTNKLILVDIGAKTEGIILSQEIEEAEDYIKDLEVGDEIQAIVGSPENEKGQILLSIKQAAMDYKWDLFDQYLKTGEAIEVRGLEINRGGLIARLMNVRGFVPASQFGHQYLGRLHQLQNKMFKVKVIEVDREKNRLIFSEKAISEAAAIAEKKQALKDVKVAETYPGIVSGVMPFGIFIRVEIKKGKSEDNELFLEGLVHISEVSWEKVENLNEFYKVGDRVKVKVLGIDENTGKLNLSIKQLSEDPWQNLVKKYPVDKKIKGEVVRLASFGAFVQLEPGVEGLIHISKIPADLDIKVGKKVDVYVESVDQEKRRMSLGLVLKEKPVGYK
jgi:small subunit ribosomal protein S1